jgi:hypothetical protein
MTKEYKISRVDFCQVGSVLCGLIMVGSIFALCFFSIYQVRWLTIFGILLSAGIYAFGNRIVVWVVSRIKSVHSFLGWLIWEGHE